MEAAAQALSAYFSRTHDHPPHALLNLYDVESKMRKCLDNTGIEPVASPLQVECDTTTPIALVDNLGYNYF